MQTIYVKIFLPNFHGPIQSLFPILDQIRNDMIRLRNKSLLIHNTFFGNQKHSVKIKTTQEHLKVCRTLSAGRRNTVQPSCNWFSNQGVQHIEEDITVFAFYNAMAHIFNPLSLHICNKAKSSYFSSLLRKPLKQKCFTSCLCLLRQNFSS